MRRIRVAGGNTDIEVGRGDLVRALYAATKNDVEYRFGDSVRSIAQDGSGVDVTFEHGPADRYDLVVGADGLHSQVRALAFGPESDYLRYLGLYAGGALVDPKYGVADRCLLYNVPGRAVAVYSFGDEAGALFLFRRPEPLNYHHRDAEQHKQLVADAFAGDGWLVPELLRDVRASADFYFDSVSQIRMRTWSRGRVTLVGDAGYGPALLSGSGSSLAMVGAYVLAGELAGGEGALARYEAAHRPLVARAQRSATSGGGVLVPRTRGAIGRRDLLGRLSWLQVAAARLGRRRPGAGLAEYPVASPVL
jgi:2-polyprenyl-6-methoxyphenol hydroxylase-like FAD-dependent oxidoreductase